ncbi:MAG TPA: DUF3788 family protein [Candidatus Acidoferrales bacterium]|nr:DUF3788 family protein [Candidatus Acidoferrales bacterium]
MPAATDPQPPNAFIGRTVPPGEADLKAALGPAKPFWDELIASLARDHGIHPEPWNSYSPKAGWSLALARAGRRIVYLSPFTGAFRASFALSDKAVAAAKKSALPRPVIRLIAGARRYAEGTAVRIEVHKAEDLAAVTALAAIKLGN